MGNKFEDSIKLYAEGTHLFEEGNKIYRCKTKENREITFSPYHETFCAHRAVGYQ